MKWRFKFIALVLFQLFLFRANVSAQSGLAQLPFAFPALKAPVFKDQIFDIRQYGAEDGGVILNSEAINKAVTACSASGGGTVLVPKGLWLTGAVHLKSNVNLHLDENAELRFSEKFEDYLPVVLVQRGGYFCYNYSPFVYAKGCENVGITGKGTLNGRGQVWWPWKDRQPGMTRLFQMGKTGVPIEKRVFGTEADGVRPPFIQFLECKNILVEEVTILDGPSWNVHPVFSENMIIRKVKIRAHGPNNDGIDPDGCKNVLIEDCDIDVGDDNICLKSGRDEEAWKMGRSCENIVVRRCKTKAGHGGLVIGSEMSAGVKNVWIENCHFSGTDRGLRFKSRAGRGGVVENVWAKNITMDNIRAEAIVFDLLYDSEPIERNMKYGAAARELSHPPLFKNFHIEQIVCNEAKTAISLRGLPGDYLRDISFSDIRIKAENGVSCLNAKSVHFNNISINHSKGALFQMENCRDVKYENANLTGKKQPFVLLKGIRQAVVVLPETEPLCVQMAVKDLIGDVEKITGKKLAVVSTDKVSADQARIIVGTAGVSDWKISKYDPAFSTLKGKWENYHVRTKGKDLVITGSDERGTMFGIYHFIGEYLGIDPLYFWSDKTPEKKTELHWEDISIQQKTPSFQYRGWFVNDEDLLTEWYESGGKRNIDYAYYGQVVNPAVMAKLVESMVRQRMNLIIPASFIDIRNPAEAALVKEAAKRGVFVSMHHVEPMGVSAFTFFNYWKEKNKSIPDAKPPLFSFFSSREKLEEIWRVYAQEWAKYPNVIWQIGLRGIADRPMWMADPGIPQSDADRGKLISEAMAVQMEIIKKIDKRPNPPITTTLWAEGSTLNQAGHLKIPEKVTVVFSDNCPGWKWQKDFYQTSRTPHHAYGVYYHHQLWSAGPHLAQGIAPWHTYQVFQDVLQMQSNAYAILNVSNIREFQLGLAASAAMLYDVESYHPEGFTAVWMRFHYGQNAGPVQKAYRTYFDSFVLHDQQQVPMLLDGQTRSFALSILKKLSLQISDPEKYRAEEIKARQVSTEASWGKTSLNDAHPQPAGQQELLEKVTKQEEGHRKALEEALKVLPLLNSQERTFFETNLLSQIKIMLGLEKWLISLLAAGQALNDQQQDRCKEYLKEAVLAFDQMNEGKELNVRGGKWANWYRGEKKMNLINCKQLTESAYALIR